MDKTVLFACDNKTLTSLMGILLRRMGFMMVSADTGPKALVLSRVVNPDVVMFDTDISDFAGLDRFDRYRAGGSSIPPVLMLVGKPTEEAELRCIESGASAVVTKPVSVKDLHQGLQECLFSATDRRRCLRARATVKVSVCHEGTEHSLMTETLSACGAFIRHDQPLPVGAVVDIFLPVGDEECMFLSGKVLYNEKPCRDVLGVCPGFAVEFVNPDKRDVEAIDEFVSSLMTEDLSDVHGSLFNQEKTSSPPRPADSAHRVYSAMRSYIVK